jgi:hypothetical protein
MRSIGMMNMQRKAIGIWALGFALLLAGCAATVGGPPGGGLGTVRVEVSGLGPQGPQRTAYPTLPGTEEVYYTYTWTDITDSESTEVKPEQDIDGKFILVAARNYKLAVNAYLDDTHTKLVGTGVGKVADNETIIVAEGKNQTVTVALKPVDGTGDETRAGTLAYTITYPEGATVLSLTLQNLGDESIVFTLPAGSESGGTLTGTKADVPAGEYLLRATLVNSTGMAGMSETVHIYGNMTTTVPGPGADPSAASFVFTEEDFAAPVPEITGGWVGGFEVVREGGILKSITPTGKPAILIGRKADEQVILNIDSGGNLQFRGVDSEGFVPIGSYGEFQLIRTTRLGPENSGDKYKQEADLDLMGGAEQQWTAVGDHDNQFTGTFDGGGKAISNLYINKPSSGYQGLFGCVGSGGTVQNVHIASGSVTGRDYVGGVAGHNYGTITASSNSSNVSGYTGAGGVAGKNDGTITDCSNTGNVFSGPPPLSAAWRGNARAKPKGAWYQNFVVSLFKGTLQVA